MTYVLNKGSDIDPNVLSYRTVVETCDYSVIRQFQVSLHIAYLPLQQALEYLDFSLRLFIILHSQQTIVYQEFCRGTKEF